MGARIPRARPILAVVVASLIQLLVSSPIVDAQSRSPTYSVRGRLLDYQDNAIVIESEGRSVVVTVAPHTRTTIRARGSLDFLVPGAVVEVNGDVNVEGRIRFTLTDRLRDMLVVYLDIPPKPPTGLRHVVRLGSESAQRLGASVPIRLFGIIVSREPFIVRGLPGYRSEYGVTPTTWPQQGSFHRQTIETAGRRYAVELPPETTAVTLDVGRRIDLIGPDARAYASMSSWGGSVARSLGVDGTRIWSIEAFRHENQATLVLGEVARLLKRNRREPARRKLQDLVNEFPETATAGRARARLKAWEN